VSDEPCEVCAYWATLTEDELAAHIEAAAGVAERAARSDGRLVAVCQLADGQWLWLDRADVLRHC